MAGGYVQLKSSGDEDRRQAGADPATSATAPAAPTTPTAGKPSATGTVGATSRGTPSASSQNTSQPATPRNSPPPEIRSTTRAQPGDPVRVSVPSLGVSARVLSIRARGGTLVPPSNPLLVGWWSDGARPGAAKGSAIITGHTVHTGGGAFDDLDRLAAGDTVSVTTKRGAISYVVSSVTVYRKKTLARQAARLFDQSVPGRLVLVTCEDWDGTAYLSNAVVIAVPKR
ncbi:class F sortase [Kribbella shirazensis]|uniref:LPXTG-site transpeptidase (Sortase) family protein n=1 Tax=Kribbella shirazensis TaxID=1105143 RepID=A0A7X5ZZT1_9ACTN|nr:LPXTG-site transpeptidase (sortase) family protein [Kribbella shirazensis]